MIPKYNLDWLINKFDQGEPLEFLSFWGHSNNSTDKVGKFCLSQWFELPFIVDNIHYKTAEHWMMAHKALLFEDLKAFQKIVQAKTPGEVKKLGREVLGFDDQIWNANRFKIVVNGNIHKFNQHPDFANFFTGTKERILVEASPVDKIWGVGLSADDDHIDDPHCWEGQNLLGFALMEARDFLNEFGHFDNMESKEPPPWKAYPKIDPADLFWRMGNGQDIIAKFADYYNSLTERDKVIFRLSNPTPYAWKDFFIS